MYNFGKIRIDSNKRVHQKSDVCHYWYFLNYNFTFQRIVCNNF